ncbi:hypothetical protein BT67DRAFT_161448 [Trichocladium antarcticum]|uniref:Uncharacterized protein n=1 Tax=Trichocladium antarcticum TaxID=1450529 RepID=A0AAN6UDP1_9PEZI|nr:hypothetical protein BT67DRAFT_161448 [Trichocladium antarcticum]
MDSIGHITRLVKYDSGDWPGWDIVDGLPGLGDHCILRSTSWRLGPCRSEPPLSLPRDRRDSAASHLWQDPSIIYPAPWAASSPNPVVFIVYDLAILLQGIVNGPPHRASSAGQPTHMCTYTSPGARGWHITIWNPILCESRGSVPRSRPQSSLRLAIIDRAYSVCNPPPDHSAFRSQPPDARVEPHTGDKSCEKVSRGIPPAGEQSTNWRLRWSAWHYLWTGEVRIVTASIGGMYVAAHDMRAAVGYSGVRTRFRFLKLSVLNCAAGD